MSKYPKIFRIPRRAAPIVIGLAAAAGIAGCASARPYNPANLEPAQLGQVQQICRSVMGIPVGIGLSVDCVGSLSQSAVELRQGDARSRALGAARSACLGQGLSPGDPGLAVCQLSSLSEHTSAANGRTPVRIDTDALEKPAKSYFYASFAEVRRREQIACARLGYEPIDGRFATCVASLNAALFASEHPMQ